MMKDYYKLLNISQNMSEEELYKKIKKKIECVNNEIKKENNISSKVAGKTVIALCESFLLTLKHYGSKENYDKALKLKYDKKVKRSENFDFKKKIALFAAGAVIVGGIVVATRNLETVEIPVYTGQTLGDICKEYNISEFEIIGDSWRTKAFEYNKDTSLTVVSTNKKVDSINEHIESKTEEMIGQEVETYGFNYIVKSGDTASELTEELKLVNLSNKDLYTGDKLWLETTDSDIAEEMQLQYEYDTAEPFATEYEYYEVQPGDNISKIAGKYGVTSPMIVKFNNIKDISDIKVGQKIKIVYEYVEGKDAYYARLEAEKESTMGSMS